MLSGLLFGTAVVIGILVSIRLISNDTPQTKRLPPRVEASYDLLEFKNGSYVIHTMKPSRTGNIEQLKEIRAYQKYLVATTNKEVSLNEAATQWVKLYAKEWRENNLSYKALVE